MVEEKGKNKEIQEEEDTPKEEIMEKSKEEGPSEKTTSNKEEKKEVSPEETPKEKKSKAKKSSSKKENISKEDKKESPKEDVKETSKEEIEEPPKEDMKETSKEEVEEPPKEDVKETPKEEVEETPKEEVKETSKEEVEEPPKEEVTETPKEEVEEPQSVDKVEEPDEKEAEEEKKPRSRKSKKEEGPFPEELIFGKYNTRDVIVEDPSLQAHINLDPAYVPHSSARHANKPFYKAKISIVERLVNSIMRTEKYTGKKTKSYKAVLDAFEIIADKTKQNPVQILVRAIENSAPREEVTRLKFGGISVPKAVDAGPSRRLDIALRNISVGTVRASHKNRKSISVCLANELLAASNGDIQSYAVSKRDEIERVAKSAH